MEGMELKSPAFVQGGQIPQRFTCQGENINPPLEFMKVPKEAKSLVLIVDDPDVPPSVRKDRMWVHWVIYDIPPHTKKIAENMSIGVKGKNTAGELGYMGPCPPDREHRYFFKLFALDIKLELSPGATKDEVLKLIEGHVLAKTELMGRYVKS